MVGKPGYRRLHTKKTNSSGAVSFNPHQSHPSTYIARFAANSTILLGSRSSKHKVALRHRVSLHADHMSVDAGHAVRFSGRVGPADRSKVIVMRRPASGGSWTRFAVAAVSCERALPADLDALVRAGLPVARQGPQEP